MDETSSGCQGAGRVHDPGPANLRAARQEHQVAARIRLAGDRNEKFEEFRTRPDNLAARSVANALDERGRPRHGGSQILGAARGQQLRESALAATYVPAPFRRIKYL